MQESTLEQLQSANAETRRQAAEQLGQLKDERAVEALIEALTREARNWSGNWQVKDTVASALITLGDAQVVPALVEILQHDQDVFVQELAAETLMRIEGLPLEVLVLVHQAGGGVVGMVARGHAAAVLGQMGDARAVEPLIAALQRNDKWEVLCTVAQSLGKIGGAQAIESLGRVFNDNRKEYVVQREAAWSLGKIGDERAVEQLVEALKGTDRDVRRTVAEVLESLGWRPANDIQRALRAIAFEKWQEVTSLGVVAVEPLIGLVQGGKREIEEATAWSMANAADPWAVEPLVMRLSHVKDIVRPVALALGNIGDARAVEPLVEALKEATSVAQQIAATALRKIRDLGAVGALLERLHAWEQQQARWRAGSTIPLEGSGNGGEDDGEESATREPPLEESGDARALEPLVRALNEVEGMMWSVAQALGNIGAPQAVEPLIAALARNEQWEALQGAVAGASERMGDARAALVATLRKNDELESLRVMAVAEALGRIRDTRQEK